jgi:signal transduction histidine kinase
MNKNIKLILFLVLCFLLVYAMVVFIIVQDKNSRVAIEYQNKIDDLKVHYDLTIDNFLSDARSASNIIRNDKRIIDILSIVESKSKKEQAILRKELYKLLMPQYNRLKKKGVHQLQFQFTNNITFLRMHKIDKFDDDLTNIRYTYKKTNETHTSSIGFEQGRSSHSIRYVFPLFDSNKKHIASAEISLSTNYIQDKMMKVNKVHTHFLVNKHIFEAKTWETKHLTSKYIHSIEHDDYMFSLGNHINKKKLHFLDNLIVPLKDSIHQKILLKKPFALHTSSNNTTTIIAFLPIKNVKDKKVVAFLVSYTNSPYLQSLKNDCKIIALVVFFILLIIFYFIYKNIKYKENLELKILEKTLELKELNNNLEQKVQDEILKNSHKDKLLAKQSRSAALGEMMDAIAHQWKQPLGVIRLHVQSLALGLEYGVIADIEDIKDVNKKVEYQTEHLISTIDEFRSFFRENQKQTNANIKKIIDETLLLMKDKIIEEKVHTSFVGKEDIELFCSVNEFKHVFINLINNSIDAFKENDIKNKHIIFEVKQTSEQIIINVIDNAGGIPEYIISKVFKSNFTTKEEGKGTGIGLYLTKQIVEKVNASIKVQNEELTIENKSYKGANFSIIVSI